MPVPTAELYDRILDHATQAAILCAENDYPRFLSSEALVQAGKEQAQLALPILLPEDEEQYIAIYIGVYRAAYQVRSRALADFPIANRHRHSL